MISEKILKIRSDIRGDVYLEALRLEAEGRKILKLNTGNPAAFGYKTPESVLEALKKGMDLAAAYSDLRGMRTAREAILSYHEKKGICDVDPDDIFLTNGVSEGVQMVTQCLLQEGDEILLPCPNYSLWENASLLASASPVFYQCREENGWEPDLDDILQKITPKTKGILVINPNNPTGAVYSRNTLERIAKIAAEKDLIIFADEIYDRLTLNGSEAISMASLAKDSLVITFNGLSKSHVICGFRAGWILLSGPKCKRKAIQDALTRLAAMRLCANTPMQLVIPAALADPMYTEKMLTPGGRIWEASKITQEVLSQIDGVDFVENHAAFYLFPRLDKEKFHIKSDRKFALDLLKAKGILIVPGSGFAHGGNDHFRIVMLPEKEVLKKAMEEIGDFLSEYRQTEN